MTLNKIVWYLIVVKNPGTSSTSNRRKLSGNVDSHNFFSAAECENLKGVQKEIHPSMTYPLSLILLRLLELIPAAIQKEIHHLNVLFAKRNELQFILRYSIIRDQ